MIRHTRRIQQMSEEKRGSLCPACGTKIFRITSLEQHARVVHGAVDLHALYVEHTLNGSVPKCRCGCGEDLPWRGWKDKYGEFIRGHNGNIKRFLPPEEVEVITQRRLQTKA